ncbi:MAG TPA: sulfatase [Vicinamibacteria bacterium]
MASAATLACPSASKRVVYDLAGRVTVADRWSPRDVLLFGTPAAEPHQVEGFYREAAPPKGDPFLWSKGEAEVSLTWPKVERRIAVLDVAPYRGVKSQSADVLLNGAPVGRVTLNDLRHRYRIALPAEAQREGDNRLRFVFSATASPADDPANPDRRQLAAAFYSVVVAPAHDEGLEDLLGRDAPHPFSVVDSGGVPALVEVGPAVVRYAVRLPAGAELRFSPDLHPSARAAGTAASFRVTVEARPGEEREAWSRVLGPRDAAPGEVSVTLPGAAGDIVRVGLHVGGTARGDRHAWGLWKAPRILGRGGDRDGAGGGSASLDGPPTSAEERRRGDPLRRGAAGTNVLFVILDAARARELGSYGYARPTTPEIDRLATEGVLFEHAYTPAVYTLAAMSSVWTSQYPERHHDAASFSEPLARGRLTLAQLLSAQGIQTAGFVANPIAGGLNGLDRGFQEFHEVWREVGSQGDSFRQTVPAWLRANKDRRFFAYVHFREPHFPYDPPVPFATKFGPDAPLTKEQRRDAAFFTDVNQGRRSLSDAEREHLVRLYDGSLAFADQEIGGIRKVLQDEGLLDRTVIIVAADHGEGLMEHGWIGHNVQLYEPLTRVPLIVRFPSGQGPAGSRVSGFVSLLDVAPTIADLFGVMGRGGSEREFQGRSLLDVIAGAPGRPAVLSRTVWDRPRYALRDERYKFIDDTRTGEEQLYDLQADPDERRNLTATDPLRTAYYRESLQHWTLGLARPEAAGAAGRVLTRAQCENLKSLGYVGPDVKCPDK